MSAIPRETRPYAPSLLDRTFTASRVNYEVLAYIGLIALSIIAHLWNLGHMAMHHDESIHAWMSWRFYAGIGSFTCAGGRTAPTYCYDPVYHGPLLYMLTLVSYFLFGDGNVQARLPQAVAGVLLVASAWDLRPYLGKRGAFLAGVLLAFSPSLLYYTRFARHDGLMVLFEFWLALGMFRYIDTGRARYLYAAAASVALAMATHELYYILFFLFGAFLFFRLLDENLPRRPILIGMGVALLAAVGLEIWRPQITPTLNVGGMALLFITVIGAGLLSMRVWDNRPFVTERFVMLWRYERRTLWTALAILVTLYVLLYSTFFADPRGIVDGLYRGISYWLGSQQEYARGDQPWYYYFMLMPLYEPLALFGSLAAAVYLFARSPAPRPPMQSQPQDEVTDAAYQDIALVDGYENGLDYGERVEPTTDVAHAVAAEAEDSCPLAPMTRLFPLFLAFWFIGALVAFSWAGEKMPWLVVHIALPGNLLVAWAIGRVLRSVNWRMTSARQVALVPITVLLLLVALGVALWRLNPGTATDQAAQANLVQGLLPLLIAGGLIYGLLSLSQRLGRRATVVLATLTVVGLVGAYMLRSTWLVVYRHPDTPVEPLIYTQSSPDVPLIAQDIRELAINQTRNNRTDSDPIGGLTMPIIMDSGDSGGEGSLAWPFQWYFRDFQRIENHPADFFQKATPDSFQVAVDAKQPDGAKEFAPVVMVYTPHVTDQTRQALEANYVKRYDSKLNWWFPEGNRCDPQAPGYKQFYYSASLIDKARKQCNNPSLQASQFGSVFAPLLWPLNPQHWPDLRRYLLYRELPASLTLNGREMQVWVRSDLVAGGSTGATSSNTSNVIKLVAQQVYGTSSDGTPQLNQPRGAAVDVQGNLYVADTGNHAIQIFAPDGKLTRTIGGLGSGEGQFNEPRGVALDAQGNIYVADTWNARVVKLDKAGNFLAAWGQGSQDLGNGRHATITNGSADANAAQPLGFFGPRSIAVDKDGRVYVVDTGNKRVVVTDSNGKFLYQWGHAGSEPGAFNEPIGIGIDGQGNVYVGDTWNSRVQVFSPGSNGQVSPIPSVTWPVSGWQPNTYDDPALAVSQGGQVYVTVPSRNEVLYANMRGDVLLRWGGAGNDTASLTLPSGAAVGPDGAVYIVDRGNNRVLKFTLPQIAPASPGQ
jgi:uncharacterized protein (TIGR03663 family)